MTTAAAATVTIASVTGRFYANPSGSGGFTIAPTSAPLWTQSFDEINFNPDPATGYACPGVDGNTRPLTDVSAGCVHTPAQGNGYQAGAGTLASFDAEFDALLQVGQAGQVTLSASSDDGWILALGPEQSDASQPTYVSGVQGQHADHEPLP